MDQTPLVPASKRSRFEYVTKNEINQQSHKIYSTVLPSPDLYSRVPEHSFVKDQVGYKSFATRPGQN